ncbi:sulfite exporter TauE/SafE family protein [Virgibacillus flavescens]|uniref:sulfite exporter TauE/SafE family protein n=1 Tax=Virgibacillus flavescens TaxID=1611422 RepID=UPI003D334ABC
METLIIFIVIIFFASILQTSTGFGFSIMATPFLLLLFEPREAIQINLILSFVISLALISKIKQDVDVTTLKRFIIGSLAGIPIGIITFVWIDMTVLKLTISIIILCLTLLLILNYRIRQTLRRDYSIGGLSGAFTTFIGMPGPPILLYFSGTNTSKEVLRATTLAFYLFIYLVSLITQIIFVGTSKVSWISSLEALPIVVVGLFVGQLLFKRINQQVFRIMTYLLLLFTGIYLLYQQL